MTRREFSRVAVTTPIAMAVRGSAFSLAQDSTERDFFYKPANAWAADFIPLYAKGEYYLYYLHDWRNKEKFGEGTPWYLITTSDFVHFSERGEMLARGSKDQQDLYVFTGSAVEGLGRFHIFYTGHNPYLRKAGSPQQLIMHAESTDLLHWTKVPADTFGSPGGNYEVDDWRDPFVFWNDEAREYWMLVCARLKAGPSRRRGCTALCASKDLKRWEVREPLLVPGLYHAHECPDLFRIGDWWYLLFSEYSDACKTRYRMARNLKGPWLTPRDDTFDTRAYYAAKTASDGHRRFLFGWNPTRSESKDYRPWNWGGNLVVHELSQERDGTLSVNVPATVDAAFSKPAPFELRTGLGDARIDRNTVRLAAPGSFGCAPAGAMPSRCKIEATLEFDRGTGGCGIMLRSSDDFESAYYVRLEPGANRMVFDTWPRPGDVPFMVELERPVALAPGKPVELKILVDGTVGVVYANGKMAMSTRMYNLSMGNWGVFVKEGTARFRNLRLSTA